MRKEEVKTFLVYCFYGLLATLIETGLYSLFYIVIGLKNISATVISWLLTVIFAFFTNKIFVYRNRDWAFTLIIKQILSFFSFRLTTGLLNAVFMVVMVDVLGFNGVIMKITAALFVGVANYFLGRFLIFRRSRQKELPEP